MKKARYFTTIAVFLLGMTLTSCTREEIRWQDRVLPLPQEMEISGHSRVRAGDIRYTIRAKEDAAPYETVRFLLDGFARGGSGAALEIELVLVDETPDAVPAELRERLKAAPNGSQAYVMVSRDGRPDRITIAAKSSIGLLYGAHTVRQLILPGRLGETVEPDTRLAVPQVRIVDWPDVAYRGTRESSAYNSFGWNSQWKLNLHCLRLATWRGDNAPFGGTRLEVRRMADIDSDRFRAWVRWAQEIGLIFMPGIDHLGHMGATGLAGISPAVYTEENPRPANRMAWGFCWAAGQEIYTVLLEELRKSAAIAAHFPEEHRVLEVLLTEHAGTSCFCPECDGANGYILETEAILRIFEALKAEDPSLRMKITLSQGSRPVNDQIIERIAAVPGAGISYYDGQLTYRMYREPMIPDALEAYSRAGGFVDVCMTIIPGRWNAQTLGSIPQYVQERAQEFAEKRIDSAAQFDQVGTSLYWPLNMAAWGEYLWNPNGRSVEDFARAYATITGIEEPDLFGRWADKAGEAAYELGVSQYLGHLSRAIYSGFPEVISEDDFQQQTSIRLDKALRDAREALMLARMADVDVMRWESSFTLASVQALALRLELQDVLASPHRRGEADRLLNEMDACARIALASLYVWHDQVMEDRNALEDAPGFLRPPEVLFAGNPRVRDRDAVVPFWTQWRTWHGLLRAGDLEWMTASLVGIPYTRGVFAPVEIAHWDADVFEGDRAVLELDLTDRVSPEGGHYLVIFELEEGVGNHLGLTLTGVRGGTGDTRVIHDTSVTSWHGRRESDSTADFLLRIPAREEDESWMLEARMRTRDRQRKSTGFASLRRVWAWDEIPEETIDRLLEE